MTTRASASLGRPLDDTGHASQPAVPYVSGCDLNCYRLSPMLRAFLDGVVNSSANMRRWTVAGTTIWSGLSYIGASGFKILKQPGSKKPKPPQA